MQTSTFASVNTTARDYRKTEDLSKLRGWSGGFVEAINTLDPSNLLTIAIGPQEKVPVTVDWNTGKFKGAPGWPDGQHVQTLYAADRLGANGGLILGKQRDDGPAYAVIDLDFVDPGEDPDSRKAREVSAAKKLVLDFLAERLGQIWVRRSWPFRAQVLTRLQACEGLPSQCLTDLKAPCDEMLGKIELLGTGKQSVLTGIHHSGSMMTWFPWGHEEFEDEVPAYSAVPEVADETALENIWEGLAGYLASHAYAFGRTKAGSSGSYEGTTDPAVLRGDLSQVLKMLRAIGTADLWQVWTKSDGSDGQFPRYMHLASAALNATTGQDGALAAIGAWYVTIPGRTTEKWACHVARWQRGGLLGNIGVRDLERFAMTRSDLQFDFDPIPEEPGVLEDLLVPDKEAWDDFDPPLPDEADVPRSIDQIRTVADAIAYFNVDHCVTNEGGKTAVLREVFDRVMNRRVLERMSFSDFKNLYDNRRVLIRAASETDKAVFGGLGSTWLKSLERRTYTAVTFDPSGPADPDTLNLWRGWALQPCQGDWSRMRNHLQEIICGGNEEAFEYLLNWLARLFQRPGEAGEVAVVLRGGEGVGKGTLGNQLVKIVGENALKIENTKHLTGNFNAHLRNTVFLFADEAFFVGDRAGGDVLKSLITEPYITIEAKHQNAIQAPNFLHVLMASNKDWVVPVSKDSRRYFVLDVPDTRQKDHTYFAAIHDEMDNDGRAAMLDELLSRDITRFNVRDFPVTDALMAQREQSFDGFHQWLFDLLSPEDEEAWQPWRPIGEDLYPSYLSFVPTAAEFRKLTKIHFGRKLASIGFDERREYVAGVMERPKTRMRGYEFGTLVAARAKFELATGTRPDWR